MKILIIDEDEGFKKRLQSEWTLQNVQVDFSRGGQEAIRQIGKGGYNAVLLAVEHLNIDSLYVPTLIKEHNTGVEIFIIAHPENIDTAKDAVQRGAHSFLIRPVDVSLLESIMRKVVTRAITMKNHRLLEEHVMVDLLGSTPAMEKILNTIAKIAPTNSGILLQGETGTGKEFVANLIHRLSNRPDEPFVAVNCGAIPENLIESELFGSKKGAYTGSVADRKGLFEEADQGTLFLDEVGELPHSLQVKLLRFLQDKEIRKVGDTENRYLDVRVIAATNRNLKQAVAEGEFREDLYYRLNVFLINLPPLRERKTSIPHLIRFFVKKYAGEGHGHIKGIAKDAENILMNYEYPGNIRELENIIEHAVVLCEGDYIMKGHLPESLIQGMENQQYLSLPKSGDVSSASNAIYSLAEMEKRHILQALQTLDNNQTEVARRLGISRSTLWRKIKEHDINVQV